MFKLMPKFTPKLVRRRAASSSSSAPATPLPAHALGSRALDAAEPANHDVAACAATATGGPLAPIIIADRGEFIDALARLRRGHVLVRPRAVGDHEPGHGLLDSAIVYTSFEPLLRYGLISEYRNADGFSSMRYYRLTERGQHFANRACKAWRQRPLLQRLAVRLTG
jgi:hypothetical protein